MMIRSQEGQCSEGGGGVRGGEKGDSLEGGG